MILATLSRLRRNNVRGSSPSVADLGVGINVRAAAATIDEVAAGPDRTAKEVVAKNLTAAA
jgi:hypothetical protein